MNAVFSGHEHVYERLKPEEDIRYFILGQLGKLMTHDFRSKQDMKVGVGRERAFMIVEIAGDNLYFQTISRAGQTLDSGTVARRGNERNLTLIFMDSFFEPTDIRRPQWTKTSQQQKTTAY